MGFADLVQKLDPLLRSRLRDCGLLFENYHIKHGVAYTAVTPRWGGSVVSCTKENIVKVCPRCCAYIQVFLVVPLAWLSFTDHWTHTQDVSHSPDFSLGQGWERKSVFFPPILAKFAIFSGDFWISDGHFLIMNNYSFGPDFPLRPNIRSASRHFCIFLVNKIVFLYAKWETFQCPLLQKAYIPGELWKILYAVSVFFYSFFA